MSTIEELLDTYRAAVSQRVAFNSREHRETEMTARKALIDYAQRPVRDAGQCPHCKRDDGSHDGWCQFAKEPENK